MSSLKRKWEINKDKSQSNRSFWIFLTLSCLIVFLFEFFGTFGIRSITNNSSEFNVMAIAADLAGYNWKDTILKEYYYGFPASVILSLVFRFSFLVKDSNLLLHGLLVVNIVIHVITVATLFLIISKITEHNNWKKDYFFISLVTVACSLFMSSQVLTKAVTNENVLVMCFMLAAFGIVLGCEKKSKLFQILNGIFLAVCCIVAYATNGRGLILIGLIFLIAVLSFFYKSEKVCSIIAFIATFLLLYLVLKITKKYFVNTYFHTDRPLKNNDSSGVFTRFISLLNLDGIRLYINLCIGWFEYFVVSTYGLGIVSLYASVRIVLLRLKKKKEVISDSLFYMAVFNLMFLLMITVLGISFYHDSFTAMFYNPSDSLSDGRVDKLVYGRYISTVKPVSIAIAFMYMKYLKPKKKLGELIGYVAFYAALATLFMDKIFPVLLGKRYASVDIPEFAMFFGNFEQNYKFGHIYDSVNTMLLLKIMLIIFIISLFFYLRKRIELIAIVCMFANMIAGVWFTQNMMIPRSEYFASSVNQDFIEYVKNESEEVNQIVIVDRDAYLYQFFLPNKHIISYSQIDEEHLSGVDDCIVKVNAGVAEEKYEEHKTLSKVLMYVPQNDITVWEEKSLKSAELNGL